jgi:hypothetical protein
VKKQLSFSSLFIIADVAAGALLILVPALLLFLRLKHAAHGAENVSFGSGEYRFSVSTKHLLPFALHSAALLAQKPLLVLYAPAKFVEIVVSLLASETGNWHPEFLLPATWRCLTYPIYALPAWFYAGRGIDALFGRSAVGTSNVVLSLMLALVSALFSCVLRFGLSASERVDEVPWWIAGFGL